MKVVTLLFLRKGDQLLLAMKKRGHGEGRWNGVGGKTEPNETVEAAAIRECQEEIGVTPNDLERIGHLQFFEVGDPDFHHDCHIFLSTSWEGEPVETEEMRPRWFTESAVPYESMWPDDAIWLPLLLAGKKFSGEVHVDGKTLAKHSIQEVTDLDEA